MDVDKEPDFDEDDEQDKEDDKLYCVCKTRYDEDRVMIACDRYVTWLRSQMLLLLILAFEVVMNGITPNALICQI